MKKIEISQSDVFYIQALELLLNEGHLKVHNVDRDELVRTAKVLEWVKQYAVRLQVAYNKPSEITPADLTPPAPKSPKRRGK